MQALGLQAGMNAAAIKTQLDRLATLDITGGNSGSPILNSRGEWVGLAFDDTLDSVISDWNFNPATTRTIAMDTCYMLWQIQVLDHPTPVKELGVQMEVATATR